MKVAAVLVVALFSMASAKPNPKGTPYVFPGRNTGKIVGGVEATPHEYPFIVDMRRPAHYCAGSIIALTPNATSSEWCVTAAHCSQNAPSGYTLTAGEHNMNQVDGTEQVRQVVQIINHPRYGSPLQYENDIALMKVSPPFEFNEYVRPVILPEAGFEPCTTSTVIGWGALTEGGASPSSLYKVDVPYVNDTVCNTNYGGTVAASMVCYGVGGKDSCQGDSGGPIFCETGDDFTLVGIVSWGQGCARPNYPGVYSETSYFTQWIRSTLTPTAEDPAPVTEVTTCGGLIESSSASIKVDILAPNQRCVWTIKAPYDSIRFKLNSEGYGDGNHLFVSKYDGSANLPGSELVSGAPDYVSSGGVAFLTVVAGSEPVDLDLEFYSSGFGDNSPGFSGFEVLTDATGSFQYPASGNYGNNENAVFVLSPDQPGDRGLTFTALDVENDTGCTYDAVSVYHWMDGGFVRAARFCGTTRPPQFKLEGGLCIVTFTTDSSVVGRGFTFQWV